MALALLAEAPRAQDDSATVYLDKRAALEAVFPHAARVVELRHLLSAGEAAAIEALTGRRLDEGGFFLYAAFGAPGAGAEPLVGEEPTACAVIVAEVGKVRPITHIVSVKPDGTVGRVAVMIYRESHGADVASERFMAQYAGKSLADPLRIDRDIINIAGSTLSGHAICRGVRKALAVVQVVLRDVTPAERAALLAGGVDVTPEPGASDRPEDTTRVERLAPGRLRAERVIMGSACSIEAYAFGVTPPRDAASATETTGATSAAGTSDTSSATSATPSVSSALATDAAAEPTLEAALRAALDEIARWDAVLSDWRPDTPLSRLNAAPVGEAQPLDPDLEAWLADSAHWHELTGGAFDPSVGALVAAWGLRTQAPSRPTPDRLAHALANSGWTHLHLDEAAGTARRDTDDLTLDPGGSGKGWALDRAAEVLRARGVRSALLSFRSTLLALDAPPGEPGWSVPVVHDGSGRTEELVSLVQGALSVSGGGFSVFDDVPTAGAEGSASGDADVPVRRGHVIDPESGVPVEAGRLAWVQCEHAAGADALSTALLVSGPALPAVPGARGAFVAHADAAVEAWPAPAPAPAPAGAPAGADKDRRP